MKPIVPYFSATSALLVLALFAPKAGATKHLVPDDYLQIDAAMSGLSAGDSIEVTVSATPYTSFTLTTNLLVYCSASTPATVSGLTELQAGTVRGFVFEATGAIGVHAWPTPASPVTIEDCTITADPSASAVYAMTYLQGYLTLKNVMIEGFDIALAPAEYDASIYVTFEDCQVHTTYVVPTMIGSFTARRTTFKNDYANGGIAFGYPAYGTYKLIQCAVADYDTVFYNYCPSDTVRYNVLGGYTMLGCGSLDSTNNLINVDPRFCDGAASFHVNSLCLPQNNSWGVQIGYPTGIGCASGDLATSTTLSTATTTEGQVLVTSDFRIPSGKTLTINSGVTVEFDDADETNLGSDSYINELIVKGTLTVDGSSNSKVEFVSSKTSPAEGDWWGLNIQSGGAATISNAVVRHACYGIAASSAPTVDVEYCTLELNEDYDIFYGAGGGTMNLTASHNTINIGGGTGILVWDASSGGTISYNTMIGNSSSTNGIQTGYMGNGASPSITANTISGTSNGAAVEVTSGSPTLTQNELKDSKQGVKVSAGNALIGTSSSSSDNLIHGNSTGILSTCSGAGNCPNCASTAPVIRNNQIYSNNVGVTREKKGHPNLGTDGSTNAGKNSIYNNTTYCIWNRTNCDTIQAQGNWFGGDCGTPPNCHSGLVNLGNYLCSQPASGTWAVEPVPEALAQGLRMKGLWPNPSRAGVTVQFETGKGVNSVTVRIFDVAGRLIRDLGEQQYEPGVHDVAWDGSTDNGVTTPNGLYFVRVMGDGRVQGTTKVLVTH